MRTKILAACAALLLVCGAAAAVEHDDAESILKTLQSLEKFTTIKQLEEKYGMPSDNVMGTYVVWTVSQVSGDKPAIMVYADTSGGGVAGKLLVVDFTMAETSQYSDGNSIEGFFTAMCKKYEHMLNHVSDVEVHVGYEEESLFAYYPVSEKKNIKVQLNNFDGGSNVEFSLTDAEESSLTRMSVTSDNVNVRKEPSRTSAILGQVDIGTQVTVFDMRQENTMDHPWYLVETDYYSSQKGSTLGRHWMYGQYLAKQKKFSLDKISSRYE